MYRAILTSTSRSSTIVATRPFSTSRVARKTATEKLGEVADKVNKSVGRGLASAIESGEQATEKTKEAVGTTKNDASRKAEEVGNVASQKANQASVEAKNTKDQFKGAAKK